MKSNEEKWREEARIAWKDSCSQDNEGGVDSVGFIFGYLEARLKAQEEYAQTITLYDDKICTMEDKIEKLEAENKKLRELVRVSVMLLTMADYFNDPQISVYIKEVNAILRDER